MILLRLISFQYARKHVLRSLLTLAGIMLGVAVFVGMHTANQSVLFAFQKTIDRIAGATQLQVSAGEPGFDEAVLERVQAVKGVRVAVPVIEAVVQTGLTGQGNLLVLGVDMLGDRRLREYDLEGEEEGTIDDPLVFLAQPDSLIVTKLFAERNHFEVNSKLTLSTMEGPKVFTVRGIMNNENETLWPGILVNTKLVIRTEDAVTVPTAAVQRSQSGNYVFIAKDGKAHVQPVNVSRTFQGISVVTSGLAGGEDVVVDGQLLLSEGTAVAPRAPKAGA